MATPAGCSSISDDDGNLLFYTNGATVWNSAHQIMQNGNGLSGMPELTQTSVIIPHPDNPNLYYLFTIRKENGNTFEKGVYYSTIEFSSTYPLGHVTDKNIHLVNEATERITAGYIPQANTYKVITFSKEPYTIVFGQAPPENPEIDTISFFDVTSSGVSVSSTVTVDHPAVSYVGAMKLSPNGQYLAIADNGQSRIFIYNMDLASESVVYDSYIFTGLFGAPNIYPYGVAFSPNSQVLYFSSHFGNSSSIYKYNLNSTADVNDKIYVGSVLPYLQGSLQLAMDGRIYIANYNQDGTSVGQLSVINDPNAPGADCGFEPNGIALSPNGSYKGLPNFVQTFFENQILTDNQCVSDTFDFELKAYGPIDSVTWNFGDGNTATTLNPTHQYLTAGTYVVKATINVYGKSIDVYKQVEAYPLPNVANSLTITQCDTDSDGIAFFNLYEYESRIDNSDTQDFELSFYHSYQDALNETDALPTPESYENTTNPEQIFTKIVSPNGCISIRDFFIESSYNYLGGIPPMYACEGSDGVLGDNKGRFSPMDQVDTIRTLFGLPDSTLLTFYASLEDAQTMSNPISHTYVSASSTLWVRVEGTDGSCGGIGTFQLVVTSNFNLDLEDEYVICHPSMQPPLLLDGGMGNQNWEWLDASGTVLSNQRFFMPTQAGTYTLRVFKTEYGTTCSAEKSFTVTNSGIPTFQTLEGKNRTIQVVIAGESSYEFSLDGSIYYGQGTAHTFTNVEAGTYTVYVRDQNNCEPPISQEVSLIGLPLYFTPNGDGFNDTWQIKGLSSTLYKAADIWIFDRYGKILKTMDLLSNDTGWDGTLNGQTLMTSDYWYKATLIDQNMNQTVITGHFTLKR